MGEGVHPQETLRGLKSTMDVKAFLSELLSALAEVDLVEDVALRTEGFIVSGRAFLKREMFLQVYFNESTGTLAFALIRQQERIWGIDKDNIRGWHIHPLEDPGKHLEIHPMSVSEIVERLTEVLEEATL